ncbi:MAG: type II toxin-antitoxin system RelE/ParE family toxin [Aliishimia sp.]
MAAYRLTKQADADLAGLYRYGIKEFGIKRADRYYDSLLVRLEDITETPLLLQKTDYRSGYRRSVHPPHTIYYRVIDPETVEIVRILRGQDPREAFT